MNRPHAPIARTAPPGLLLWAMLVLLSLAAAPAVWAETVVGDGKPASQSRTVADFNAIALNGSIALKLKQGNTTSVVVRGDSNLLSLVETVVESNQSLQLRWKRGTAVRSQLPVVVEVTAPQVRAVASAGSGDIEIDDMKVPRLSLSIKGSADLRASGLRTDELAVSLAGSGDLSLAGLAARVSIELAGSGDIDAGELRSDDVTVGIAGSGDVTVHATRKLAASIAGSGDVLYSGDPSVQRSVAGSGSVRKR